MGKQTRRGGGIKIHNPNTIKSIKCKKEPKLGETLGQQHKGYTDLRTQERKGEQDAGECNQGRADDHCGGKRIKTDTRGNGFQLK